MYTGRIFILPESMPPVHASIILNPSKYVSEHAFQYNMETRGMGGAGEGDRRISERETVSTMGDQPLVTVPMPLREL